MNADARSITSDTTSRAPTDGELLAVDDEGFLYVEATGEIVGHINDQERPFRVESREAVEWVLERRRKAEAAVVAIEAQRAAVNANLDSMLVDHRNRLRYLAHRFDAEIEAQARREIQEAGGRSKTAKYVNGQVAFRTTQPKNEITDAGTAVSFVDEWARPFIKKSVDIKGVKAAIEAYREEVGEEPDVSGFFTTTGPRESVTISTGIKIGKDPQP